MTEYLVAAASFGLFGSLHCVGMCGGFAGALAIAQPKSWRAGLIIYQLGRITSYAMLGLTAGFLGTEIEEVGGPNFQNIVTIIVGLIMAVYGLNLLGIIPDPLRRLTGSAMGFLNIGRHIQSLAKKKTFFSSIGAWLISGIVNGFLPCGLVYAALAMSLESGNVLISVSVMVLFGMGTIPAMMIAPGVMRLMTPKLRGNLLRLAGAVLIMYGLFTSLRGSGIIHMKHNHPVVYPDGKATHNKNIQGEFCIDEKPSLNSKEH